jgi:RNA polymerase sigma factor (sigma-70 family)
MTLAALYTVHRPYVRGVMHKLGVTEPDVDDLTQEVFCVLLRRPLEDSEPRGARRWLYQTARRVVSNYRRGRRREASRRERAWEPLAASCPEAEAMDGEARERLDRAVGALPAEARALYRLSEAEGLPGPVVAQRLGLNPNTTSARIRALRRRLLQALLLVALLLAALLVSATGCGVVEKPSSAVSQAPSARRAADDLGLAALPGPALAAAAVGR